MPGEKGFDRGVFDRWLRLVLHVPESQGWLLQGGDKLALETDIFFFWPYGVACRILVP